MTDYVIGERVNLYMEEGLVRYGEVVDIHKTNNSFVYYVVRTNNGVELACAGSMRKIEKPKDIKAKYSAGDKVKFLTGKKELIGTVDKASKNPETDEFFYDIKVGDYNCLCRVPESEIDGVIIGNKKEEVEEKAEASGVATAYMNDYVKDILGKKVAEKDNDKLSIKVNIMDMDEFKELLKEANDKINKQNKLIKDLEDESQEILEVKNELCSRYDAKSNAVKIQDKMLEISAKYYSELLLNYTGGRNHRRYYEPHQLLTMWEEAAKKELSNEKEK